MKTERMKYVIVGGVAGGATAATRIRRIDEFAEIVLLEKGKYISYANCGLPYYIGGTIKERENLFLQTPESFGMRFNVEVRVENEVLSIDAEAKHIIIKDSTGKEYTETYDKLLLSPGAVPIRPPFEGIDSEGIFTLRDVRDTDKIKDYINKNKAERAVIVGAGFIGLEMTENLHLTGAHVTIVERLNQVMAPIDYSMATLVHEHLLQNGVSLFLEQSVSKFSKQDNQLLVHLESGQKIEADIVILSIGVRPEVKLAQTAAVKIGETGGIWVDEYLQTSVQDVYAVGDAIEFPHPITNKPWLNFLAGPANRQARIVADNMVLGNKIKYEGAIGTGIAKVFDLTVASTGLAAKRLKQMNIPYISSWTHSNSHAGYYPDALPLSLKITFHPKNGKLLGAQGVGYAGIDKRIDQIALLIKKGGSIFDLMQLEQAYAPPFSSAKDPVAIAGYVANNIMMGTMPVVTWRTMQQADPEEVLVLDVRTKDEYKMGAIVGSVNIPLDNLRDRLTELPMNKSIYVYCAIGLRGYLALKILKARGFNEVYNLSGGYKTYIAAIAELPKNTLQTRAITAKKEDYTKMSEVVKTTKIHEIDACGLACPGPIMKLKQAIDGVNCGEQIEIVSTDAGFMRDSQAWCNTTGNILISSEAKQGKYRVLIEKGSIDQSLKSNVIRGKGKSFIMFSDDLDKALATFVLANGAAATGEKVSIFFTFWGLNVIKKGGVKAKKDIFGKMFGMMLPSSSLQLKLSKMNMWGMGRRMMRYIMKKNGVDSLESLREQAIQQGVEFIACQMSMDVMGVKQEELIDNATIGGVATYMERANESNINLFI